jgi:hypothetical protein
MRSTADLMRDFGVVEWHREVHVGNVDLHVYIIEKRIRAGISGLGVGGIHTRTGKRFL